MCNLVFAFICLTSIVWYLPYNLITITFPFYISKQKQFFKSNLYVDKLSVFYQARSRFVYHYIKKGKGKNPYKPHTHIPKKMFISSSYLFVVCFIQQDLHFKLATICSSVIYWFEFMFFSLVL